MTRLWDAQRAQGALRVAVASAISTAFLYMPSYKPQEFQLDVSWLLITVLVVQEKTLIESLRKSLQRIIGTVLGGLAGYVLGIAAQQGSAWSNANVYMVIVPSSVFVFWYTTRAFPKIGTDYQYAGVITGVTFVIVLMSMYGGEDNTIAFSRAFSIVVAVIISVICSMAIFPVSAEDELNGLIADSLSDMAESFRTISTFAATCKADETAGGPSVLAETARERTFDRPEASTKIELLEEGLSGVGTVTSEHGGDHVEEKQERTAEAAVAAEVADNASAAAAPAVELQNCGTGAEQRTETSDLRAGGGESFKAERRDANEAVEERHDFRTDAVLAKNASNMMRLTNRGAALVKVSANEWWLRRIPVRKRPSADGCAGGSSKVPLRLRRCPAELYNRIVRDLRRNLAVSSMISPYLRQELFRHEWGEEMLAHISASVATVADVTQSLSTAFRSPTTACPAHLFRRMQALQAHQVAVAAVNVAAHLEDSLNLAPKLVDAWRRRVGKSELAATELGSDGDGEGSWAALAVEPPPLLARLKSHDIGRIDATLAGLLLLKQNASGELDGARRPELTPEGEEVASRRLRATLGGVACLELVLRLVLRTERLLKDVYDLEQSDFQEASQKEP